MGDEATDTLLAEAESWTKAKREATVAALPGPLKTALAGRPVTCAGIAFRELKLGDAIILERIGSPLHKVLNKLGGATDEPKFTMDELFDLVYLLSHAYDTGFLQSKNPETFRACAREYVASTGLEMRALAGLAMAVGEVVRRAFGTAVGYEAPAGDGEGKTVFTRPPADRTTGSAGGCNCTGC